MQRLISRSLIQLIALARICGRAQVRARHASSAGWCSACCCILAIAFFITATSVALSDVVSPSDRATSGVFVRERPSANSANIGTIQPGQQAELVGSVPYWYQVKLPDGRVGYVSKSWTQVQPTAAAAAPTAAPTSATSAEFSIHVVDVGTGLAIAVKGPDFFLIYDGGSNDDIARGDSNRFLAYLHKVFPDLREVNHLILSHPHRDHVELLPDVVAAYQIDNVKTARPGEAYFAPRN